MKLLDGGDLDKQETNICIVKEIFQKAIYDMLLKKFLIRQHGINILLKNTHITEEPEIHMEHPVVTSNHID